MSLSIEERFWAKVDRSGGPDACWPWTGGCFPDGYGNFWLEGKNVGSHVFAFELANGYRPPMTCHSCDNPPCCNETHLFAGTCKSNFDDMYAKGRGNKAHGRYHTLAKITEDEAGEIIKRYVPWDKVNGGRALAKEFGLSPSAISKIIVGKSWSHVTIGA